MQKICIMHSAPILLLVSAPLEALPPSSPIPPSVSHFLLSVSHSLPSAWHSLPSASHSLPAARLSYNVPYYDLTRIILLKTSPSPALYSGRSHRSAHTSSGNPDTSLSALSHLPAGHCSGSLANPPAGSLYSYSDGFSDRCQVVRRYIPAIGYSSRTNRPRTVTHPAH